MGGDCVFCAIHAEALPAARVLDEARVVAFMDAFPFRPGHVLVTLRRHAVLITELRPDERAELMETGNRVADAMRQALPYCDGVNWIVNDGRAAGQTVPHVHLHLIPRTRGDRGRVLWRFARQAFLPRQMHRRPLAALEQDASRIRACLAPGG